MTRDLVTRPLPAPCQTAGRPAAAPVAIMLALVLTTMLPVVSRAAEAGPDTIAAAWRDSLVLAPVVPGRPAELRGFCWIAPDRALALLAVPTAWPAPTAGEPAAPDSLVVLRWLRSDGTAVREEDLTGRIRRGLAWDDTFLWSLAGPDDEAPATLVRFSLDSLAVVDVFPLRGHRPRDVAWDGHAVWVVDRDAARLVRFDPETGEATRSLPAPAYTPTGVAADGRHLWVCDAGTGRLYRLTASGRRVTGLVRPGVFAFRGREVGLAWGRDGLWCWSPPDLTVRRLVPFP